MFNTSTQISCLIRASTRRKGSRSLHDGTSGTRRTVTVPLKIMFGYLLPTASLVATV